MKKEKPLTREQEAKLVKAAKKGDYEAREALAKGISGLIYQQAIRFHARSWWIPVEDLFQEAMLSFDAAVKNYKLKKGYRFTTYYCMCAANRMRSLQRKRRFEETMPLNSEGKAIANELKLPEYDTARQADALEALGQLSPRELQIVVDIGANPSIRKIMEAGRRHHCTIYRVKVLHKRALFILKRCGFSAQTMKGDYHRKDG